MTYSHALDQITAFYRYLRDGKESPQVSFCAPNAFELTEILRMIIEAILSHSLDQVFPSCSTVAGQ